MHIWRWEVPEMEEGELDLVGNKKNGTLTAKMGFLFVAPVVLYMGFVFIGYPMMLNIILSFKNGYIYQCRKTGIRGLRNYGAVYWWKNHSFSKAIMNTLSGSYGGSIFFPVHHWFWVGAAVQ